MPLIRNVKMEYFNNPLKIKKKCKSIKLAFSYEQGFKKLLFSDGK